MPLRCHTPPERHLQVTHNEACVKCRCSEWCSASGWPLFFSRSNVTRHSEGTLVLSLYSDICHMPQLVLQPSPYALLHLTVLYAEPCCAQVVSVLCFRFASSVACLPEPYPPTRLLELFSALPSKPPSLSRTFAAEKGDLRPPN